MLRIKNFIVAFICFLQFTNYCFSQPKLVVGIVVDQMRYDYIQKYWDKFEKDGFKRLVKQGFDCKNTNYNYVPTFTGPGHSSIYTGATPSVNGIVANQWINRANRKKVYCVSDANVTSVGGSDEAGKMSPKNLMSSTIGEELRKKSGDTSKVIGIALKDRAAILPAGHHANAAYWYDGSSGNWITSSYYMKQLPQWVSDFNKKDLAKKYLAQTWNTILPIEKYTESDADDNNCEQLFKGKEKPIFPYDLPALMKENGGLGLIRETPFGNSLTKDFAIETIKNENLGKGRVSDFLCVSFSSTDYIGHMFGPQSVEVEDCYLRLDKDIAEFLNFLDEWVGKDNVLVFLTADHGASEAVPCLQKKNIPAGVIDEKTISDSLKSFFVRTYKDSILIAVSDFNVYLDIQKANKNENNFMDVEASTEKYLSRMNGIAYVMGVTDIGERHAASDSIATMPDAIREKVMAGYYDERCGDIVFVLKEHWLEGYHKGTSHGSPYEYDTHVPLLWWGYNIKNGSSNDPIVITQIAPTVSEFLKIPKPRGCTSKSISSLLK